MKECSPGKILNPKTNRCVDAKGTLGKELAAKEKKVPVVPVAKKDCPPGKILNPKTNRCIDANGKLGKELALPAPKSKINEIIKVKTPEQKDIFDIINETGDILKKQIDPFDKLKLNMIGMKHIKFTDILPTYAAYFTDLRSMESDDRNYGKLSHPFKLTYINGTYKDYTFAISRYETGNNTTKYVMYNLVLNKNNVYVTLLNLKNSLKAQSNIKCNVYYELEKESEKAQILDGLHEFLDYVFGVKLKLSPKYQQIFKPLHYEDDLVKHEYPPYTKPVPPIAKYGHQEDSKNDPFFVSNIYKDILYVFWCNRTEYSSLKGYTPNAIFVVERKLVKKNYKYDNFLRLDFPSWGRLKENDRFNEMNIEELIKEIRNIIISVPFLSKFRGMSPYPRIIVE